MQIYRIKIRPLSAFGSNLLGETLFGQICWELRFRYGTEAITELLKGYTENQPFAIFSDAFPTGYIPIPTIPAKFFASGEEDLKVDLKKLKAVHWMPVEEISAVSLSQWRKVAYLAKTESSSGNRIFSAQLNVQMHNTIDRLTNTTGTDQFAPYSVTSSYFPSEAVLDIYVGLAENTDPLMIRNALECVGTRGYGRDATIGLGKFEVLKFEECNLLFGGRFGMTLSSCDLSNAPLDQNTYYKVRTHFGRHGESLAVTGQPFKKPLLLASAGAYLSFLGDHPSKFCGAGIKGISTIQSNAVHQGYALMLSLPELVEERRS